MGRLAVSSSFVTSGQTPPPLHARTVQIDDPGDLLARLAGASDVAWIRRGDGMVGLGVAARAEVDSIEVGDRWWADLAGRIAHTSELPDAWGVGPVAFGSFAFDPGHTAARSVRPSRTPRPGRRRCAGRAPRTPAGSSSCGR